MPSKGDTQINTFVGGLNTEASPLSFPPNSSLDEKNFRLNRNGSRDRRLGLDYEDDYALYDTGQTTDQIKVSRQRVFVWPTPSGFNQVEIGVIQVGTKLYFVDLFTANPSANVLHGGNSLDAADITNIIDNTVVFDFTIVNNNLIVVSEGLDTPFLLSYDYPSDTISYETARIKIRDLYGVSDGLADNERPASLSAAHEYNLRNQGWNSAVVTTCGTEVLACTQSVLGVYPSNSDTWSLGKIADVTSADIDKYDPNTLARNSFDLGRAARGHFIIDLYDRGSSRETESGITQTNVDRELGRVSTVAAMGGRLFYSGIRSRISGPDVSPKLSGAVLFSQIGLTNDQLVKCYQEADPTSPTNSDIVDTDGGIVQISEASNIVKLMQVKTSIFVFADNGIWEIRGDEGGFRATSFQVNKVSSIGVLSRDSIVEANGTIFFWANQGIFAVTPNQFQTGYDTTNVSISLIQTAYNSIPDLAKQNARGYYDISQNRVRWLFNSDFSETISVPDPDPVVPVVSDPLLINTTGSEPKVAKLDNNTAIVLYRSAISPSTIYYKVLSMSPGGVTVTGSIEQVFVNLSPSTPSGYDVIYLQDNKVLVVFKDQNNDTKVSIGNWDGSSMTFTSATIISTDFRSVLISNQFRIAKINSGRVVIAGRYFNNFRPAAIVVDIDGSDNITTGTIAFTTTANSISNPQITMLTDTKGVMSWNDFSNISLIVFTISGTTITFDGTKYAFPSLAMFPGKTNVGCQYVDIIATASNSVFVYGSGTVVEGGVTSYFPMMFTVTEASGVLSATTGSLNTNLETSSLDPGYYQVTYGNNEIVGLADIGPAVSPAVNRSVITKFSSSPHTASNMTIEEFSGVNAPSLPTIDHLYNGRYITVIQSNVTGATLRAFGVII